MTTEREDPGAIVSIVGELMLQRQLAAHRGDAARVAEINEQLKPLNVELRAFTSQLFKSAKLNLPKG